MFGGAGIILMIYLYSLMRGGGSDDMILPIETLTLKNYPSATVWSISDHSNPIVSISMVFKGGAATDPMNKSGTTALMVEVLTRGGNNKEVLNFNQEIQSIALALNVQANRDSVSLNMTVIKENLPQAIAITNKILANPSFTNEGFAKIKAEQEVILKIKKQNPAPLATQTLWDTIFNNSNAWRATEGTLEELEGITLSDTKIQYEKHIATDNLSIGVSGDLTKEEMQETLEAMLQGLREKNTLPTIEKAIMVKNTNTVIKRLPFDNAEQAVITFALPAPAPKTKNYYSSLWLNAYLGGTGGLSSYLFQKVRIEKGLVYGISTSIVNNTYGDIWVGSTQTRKENVDTVISMIQELISTIPIDKENEDLKNAKTWMLGSWVINFKTTGDLAKAMAYWISQGYDINYVKERNKRLKETTTAMVKESKATYLNPKDLTIIVVEPTR